MDKVENNEIEITKVHCGKVILSRWQCPKCNEYNLTNSEEINCSCGFIGIGKIKNNRYVCVAKRKVRAGRGVKRVKSMEQNQNYECYWCNRLFGTYIVKNKNVIKLKPVVEHKKPFSYSFDDSDDNLVLSCQICNGMKSAFIFDNEDDCRSFLARKWDKKLSSGEIEIV